MKKGILGEKVGMMQIWAENGELQPVTALKVGPCPIVQVKAETKEGYSSIQIGYKPVKAKQISKAEQGHQKKVFDKYSEYYRNLLELRDYSADGIQVGDTIKCDIFTVGEKVKVRAVSKGKGFQGVVKRYKFAGGRASHGSTFHRDTGSIGAGTDPGRVNRGKRMPGRMGGAKCTVFNLEIVKVMPDENMIFVKGSVPGVNGADVFVYIN